MTARRLIFCTAAALAGACAVPAVAAESWPARTVSLVMPYAAGGSADVLARVLAERMRQTLGKPVIVENITGAAGSIGTGRVARAAPDGHTLGIGTWSTHVANGAVYALPYDVVNDFQPIALLASSPLLIAARAGFPAKDLGELIAWLRASPDKASQGTNGPGSIMHLAGVQLQNATGARFQFVPYRGAGAAMQDLVAGNIDLYFGLPADILPHMRSGKARVFAVASPSRLAAAPEVPTTDEAGVAGLYVSAWFGLWAPKGTPSAVVEALNAAVRDALSDAAVVRQLTADLNLEIPAADRRSPAALDAFQKAEVLRWWPLIKAANIKYE